MSTVNRFAYQTIHHLKPGCGGFYPVTDGRAPSFYDLSVGEALAPRRSRGEQRRGQLSLADKSSKKTSPGVPEPEKRLHSPGSEMYDQRKFH